MSKRRVNKSKQKKSKSYNANREKEFRSYEEYIIWKEIQQQQSISHRTNNRPPKVRPARSHMDPNAAAKSFIELFGSDTFFMHQERHDKEDL